MWNPSNCETWVMERDERGSYRVSTPACRSRSVPHPPYLWCHPRPTVFSTSKHEFYDVPSRARWSTKEKTMPTGTWTSPSEVCFSEVKKRPPPLLTFRDQCVEQALGINTETVLLVPENRAPRGARGCHMRVPFILPFRPLRSCPSLGYGRVCAVGGDVLPSPPLGSLPSV